LRLSPGYVSYSCRRNFKKIRQINILINMMCLVHKKINLVFRSSSPPI
jgi:hypothetical protein